MPSQAARSFNVALVQMRCAADPDENLRHAVERLREAAARGAHVACLPELFRAQYFCQTEDPAAFDLAEPVPGPTTEALAAVAKETGLAVVGSLFERRTAGVYHNTIVVLDADGTLVGRYRKMHIPDDPAYYEKYYFTPGDLGFRAFDTQYARVGTLICWDQWYPEAARLTALRGAHVLFYPTAIGWHPSEKTEHGAAQRDAWETIQRSHAIANGVYVAAVNRVGYEAPDRSPSSHCSPYQRGGGRGSAAGDAPAGTPAHAAGIEFWGSSFVCDPFGVVLARASADREETLIVECDPRRQEEVRRHWPFLRDRRIDVYGGLACRLLDDAS